MIYFFFLIYFALILVPITKTFKSYDNIVQFPFWASILSLFFILIPLIGTVDNSKVPPEGIFIYTIMAILCFAGILLGNWLGSRKESQNWQKIALFNPNKWLNSALFLVIIGGIASIKNITLFLSGANIMSGEFVMYNFFTPLLRFGFIMALINFYYKKSIKAGIIIIVALLVFYIPNIVVLARRQIIFEVFFVILALRWVIKKRKINKTIFFSLIVIGMLMMNVTEAYRNLSYASGKSTLSYKELSKIKLVEKNESILFKGSSEIKAAIYQIAAITNSSSYDLGFFHYNDLIFNYVPAQLFGADFKESLYLGKIDMQKLTKDEYQYTKDTGSTVTGIVDSYRSFWFFGFIKFILIAYIMRRFYEKSKNRIEFQFLFVFFMTMAIHSITHHTNWFFSPWVLILIFWYPIMKLSKLNKVKYIQS